MNSFFNSVIWLNMLITGSYNTFRTQIAAAIEALRISGSPTPIPAGWPSSVPVVIVALMDDSGPVPILKEVSVCYPSSAASLTQDPLSSSANWGSASNEFFAGSIPPLDVRSPDFATQRGWNVERYVLDQAGQTLLTIQQLAALAPFQSVPLTNSAVHPGYGLFFHVCSISPSSSTVFRISTLGRNLNPSWAFTRPAHNYSNDALTLSLRRSSFLSGGASSPGGKLLNGITPVVYLPVSPSVLFFPTQYLATSPDGSMVSQFWPSVSPTNPVSADATSPAFYAYTRGASTSSWRVACTFQ